MPKKDKGEDYMLYKTLSCGDREYKLRLNAKSLVALERKLDQSIFSVFGGMSEDVSKLPSLDTIVSILHASLQAYEHNITVDEAYRVFDKYMEHGGSYAGMLEELVETLTVSGFFRESPKQGKSQGGKTATP